jgi:dihydrofolate synthase/folylpolyglutamate synthase
MVSQANAPMSSNRWPPLATSFGLDARLSALADNFSLATLAALNLEPGVSEVLPSAFEGFTLAGRLEYIGTGPRYLVDGAHTPRSIALLTDAVRRSEAPDIHLLISVSGDRKAKDLLHPLLEIAHRVTLTQADPVRSKAASLLAIELFEGQDPGHRYCHLDQVSVQEDPEAALRQAKADLSPQSLLVVTGSMYLAGRIREYLLNEPRGSADRRYPDTD